MTILRILFSFCVAAVLTSASVIASAHTSGRRPPFMNRLSIARWFDYAFDSQNPPEQLQRPISIDCRELPISDALGMLEETTGLTICLDRLAVQAAGVSPDAPVTISLQDISLRSALRLMVGKVDLEYRVEGGVVHVGPICKELTTKRYAVRDLVTDQSPSTRGIERVTACPNRHSGWLPVGYAALDSDSLIYLVEQLIAPNTWDAVGGPGIIRYEPDQFSFVITQSETTHREVADLLSLLWFQRADGGRRQYDSAPGASAFGNASIILGVSAFVACYFLIGACSVGRESPNDRWLGARSRGICLGTTWTITAAAVVFGCWMTLWPMWQSYRLGHELSRAIRSGDVAGVRAAAVPVLALDLGCSVEPYVRELLGDKNSDVRTMASEVLSLMGSNAEPAVPLDH
jgi:hypothetical protein